MPKYEVVVPISGEGGASKPGETVELSGEEAKLFLARGFVKEPEKSSSKGSANKETSEG